MIPIQVYKRSADMGNVRGIFQVSVLDIFFLRKLWILRILRILKLLRIF